jgi:hypothetical protein
MEVSKRLQGGKYFPEAFHKIGDRDVRHFRWRIGHRPIDDGGRASRVISVVYPGRSTALLLFDAPTMRRGGGLPRLLRNQSGLFSPQQRAVAAVGATLLTFAVGAKWPCRGSAAYAKATAAATNDRHDRSAKQDPDSREHRSFFTPPLAWRGCLYVDAAG